MRIESGRVPSDGPAASARPFSAAMTRARARAGAAETAPVPVGGSVREPDPASSGPGPRAQAAGSRRLLDDQGTGEAAIASPGVTASGDGRRDGAVSPPPSILAAAPLERLVVELANSGGVPSIVLAFGSEGLLVRLTKRSDGLEIALELPPSLAARSMAELLALAAAVRARGVAVVSGSVRARPVAAARPAGRALTATRGSYRTAGAAAQSERGGTVAKW